METLNKQERIQDFLENKKFGQLPVFFNKVYLDSEAETAADLIEVETFHTKKYDIRAYHKVISKPFK